MFFETPQSVEPASGGAGRSNDDEFITWFRDATDARNVFNPNRYHAVFDKTGPHEAAPKRRGT